eukprot:3868854-Prorocentrum_lima.AAC.1
MLPKGVINNKLINTFENDDDDDITSCEATLDSHDEVGRGHSVLPNGENQIGSMTTMMHIKINKNE